MHLLYFGSDKLKLVPHFILKFNVLIAFDAVGGARGSDVWREGEIEDEIREGQSLVWIGTEIEWQALERSGVRDHADSPEYKRTLAVEKAMPENA